MYEAKGMVSIVDAAYLRCYLRIDDTSEDLFPKCWVKVTSEFYGLTFS